MDEIPLEVSPTDAADQRGELVPADTDDDGLLPPRAPDLADAPWDADPADVAEQRAEVPLDEDDWA